MGRGSRSLLFQEDEPDEHGQIRCICGSEDDDGFTIQCEVCYVWQHASCVGIGKSNIPEKYYCEQCAPSSFTMHKQRLSSVDKFTKTDSLLIHDKEILQFITALSSSLQITKTDTFSIYCSRSFEPLKICLSRDQNSCGSSKFPANFYLRSIKSRGYQRRGITPKYGLFSKSFFEPGSFLCEYTGEVYQKSHFSSFDPVSCLQTFVLFIQNTPIAIDARRQGTLARFVRRSCRPNAQIELSINKQDPTLFRVNLIAMNNIFDGDEILLPNDFDFGNNIFKYECACGNPEFCLSSCLFGSFIFNGDVKKTSISQESDNEVIQKVKKESAGEDNTEEIHDLPIADEESTSESVFNPEPSVEPSDNNDEFVDVEMVSDEISSASTEHENIDSSEPFSPLKNETNEVTEAPSTPSKAKVSFSDYIKLRKSVQPTAAESSECTQSVLESSTEFKNDNEKELSDGTHYELSHRDGLHDLNSNSDYNQEFAANFSHGKPSSPIEDCSISKEEYHSYKTNANLETYDANASNSSDSQLSNIHDRISYSDEGQIRPSKSYDDFPEESYEQSKQFDDRFSYSRNRSTAEYSYSNDPYRYHNGNSKRPYNADRDFYQNNYKREYRRPTPPMDYYHSSESYNHYSMNGPSSSLDTSNNSHYKYYHRYNSNYPPSRYHSSSHHSNQDYPNHHAHSQLQSQSEYRRRPSYSHHPHVDPSRQPTSYSQHHPNFQPQNQSNYNSYPRHFQHRQYPH